VENMLNEKNKQWNDFVSNIDENDFVVIAGSIFGGTGASAIPVVLEKLNAKKEENSFYLAAIILTPYFKAFGKINERGGSPAGFKQISGKSKGWAVLLPKGGAL
jgi:predicted double-glycine peptidase